MRPYFTNKKLYQTDNINYSIVKISLKLLFLKYNNDYFDLFITPKKMPIIITLSVADINAF